MIWFLLSSTLLMALALLACRRPGAWNRRVLEMAMLLVVVLPALRWLLELAGVEHGPLAGMTGAQAAGQEDAACTMTLAAWMVPLWLTGMTAGCLIFLRQLLRVKRLHERAPSLPRRMAGRIARLLGLPRPSVAAHFHLSPDVSTPVVLPTRPGIVLLPSAWSQWPERLQISALRHEWHHVLNGDALWSCGVRLFCIVFWFHPLAWRLAAQWAEECERLADRAAVADGDPADYAQDLLGLATGREQPLSLPGLAGFLGPRGSRLHRRVSVLLKGSREGGGQGSSTRTLAVVMLLMAANCAWLGVREKNITEAVQALKQEVEIRLGADAFPAD